MPNKKLDKKTLEHYKKKLLAMKEEILRDISQIKGTANSVDDHTSDSGHALHMADVATDTYDKEFSLGLASNDSEILKKIDEALKRIENGTYGFCLATGKPISKARLEAIPYAEYCLEYQQELEKRQ